MVVETEQPHLYVAGGASSMLATLGKALSGHQPQTVREGNVNAGAVLAPTLGCDGVDSIRAPERPRPQPSAPQALRKALPAWLQCT